jgi:aldose 1-epimerase
MSLTGKLMLPGLLLTAGIGTLATAAPTAATSTFGTSADGQTVRLVTLRNDRGMVVRFSARGGTFTEIDVPDRRHKSANIILGKPDFAAWERGGPFNNVIGRYANRISGGGFSLDGVFYKLAGASPATRVVSHGGPRGFGDRLWGVETFERNDASGAVLRYTSVDGENGYPGELAVTVTYTLTDDDILRLDYRATTTKPTVLNLTNHTYWNLGGADSGVIDDEMMQVFASRWTPTDDNGVPTGEIRSVDGTPFDFRQLTRIADRLYLADPQIVIARGIDHNFVLDKNAGQAFAPAVRLYDAKSGRRMEVWTSEPAVQIYTGNYFNGTMLGANGRTIRQGDGIAFETEHFPDSPNKPNFPSTVLRPGETFQSTTEFVFSAN